MMFTETELSGVFIVEPEILEDERGFFARSWAPSEFASRGLNPRLAQCNLSFNIHRGTVRGMHFQVKPHEEVKLVRCTRGRVFDVAVDLRPHAATRYHWVAVELTQDNHRMLYIPEGFAHGYQTLDDATELCYQVSEYYHVESARGLRWDDPRLGIQWPLPVTLVSRRDREFELLTEGEGEAE
jgi:dTDP-4-dehydrorhamnose 3,5-epimerase